MRLSTPRHTRIIAISLLVSLLTSFMPASHVAQALTQVKSVSGGADSEAQVEDSGATAGFNPGGGFESIRSVGGVDTRYGLVAILVDEVTWESQASGSGFSFLGSTSIAEKIQTYAEDVQTAIPWTKTVIVTVATDESVEASGVNLDGEKDESLEADSVLDVQRMLERFYYEGNPEDSDVTRLSGVVVIGDVPLPVVNKNGHRFVSMLPYTDFEDASYVLNESTLDFVPNVNAQNLQPEAWHGLMVPPVAGQEGIDLLAEYFDRNHLYHEGDAEYATFDEKVFIGDFVTEEETVNSVSFDSYKRYTELWEEMVYYHYTSDLVEDLYREMMDSVAEGDLLDNDNDGLTDEEASNGLDDDGDGLIDEDLGDGFFGIDNDGDCLALPESQQDSNGDGINCNGGTYDEDTGREILAPDNYVDEDNGNDNNNDEDRVIEALREVDDEEGFFVDQMVDEDPPGDYNGDGCPGECGVDDNRWGNDSDGDGYPDGWEIMFGYPYDNEKRPWKSVERYVDQAYGEELDADEATAYLQAFFTDDMMGDYYQDESCMDSSGVFHPEWDDDEDGLCDEDGSDELMDNGCAYNDNDCDGEIDEDPIGLQPQNYFEAIPDLQTKGIIESLTSLYAELFDQPQGVWNSYVQQTGRWETRKTDEDGAIINDYDTAISLISKKDEDVKVILYQANEALEGYVDDVVTENLVEEIPLVAVMEIWGEMTIEPEDEDDESEVVEVCTREKKPDLEDNACLQFVNHSTSSESKKFSGYLGVFGGGSTTDDNIYMYGTQLADIDEVRDCSLFAGTNEEDGQMTQYNALYSPSRAVEGVDEDTRKYIAEVNNCVPEYANYLDDIPELCNEPTVLHPIRTLDGAIDATTIRDPEEGEGEGSTEGWESDFGACFEFREMTTFEVYYNSDGEFNDWLSKKIRKFRKNSSDDEAEDYEEFLQEVEDKKNSYSTVPGTATLRKNFSELNIVSADSSREYTVLDLVTDAGWEFEEEDGTLNDELDIYFAMLSDNEALTVTDPSSGSGMSDVEQIDIYFDKIYLSEDRNNLTTDRSDAAKISSFYKHTEPYADTVTAQTESIGSPDIPIDATRRVSFMDSASELHEIEYVNVFDAEDLGDVEQMVRSISTDLRAVAGGSSYATDALDMLEESGINEDQLEDAIAWHQMNIDEKHEYVLSYYLGEQIPMTNKAWNGYEMAAIIADGTAAELFFAFNGGAPDSEGDLEFLYGSMEAAEEALAEDADDDSSDGDDGSSGGDIGGTDLVPVSLTEWIDAMKEWITDTKNSVSSFKSYDGETYCGDVSQFEGSEDADGSGTPDAAEDTSYIRLTSDGDDILRAGGGDYMTVSASARMADGSLNGSDSYTQINLEVVSGEGVVEIVGSETITLTGGVSTFMIRSSGEDDAEAGDFTLQAEVLNRDEVSDSNTLSGTVEASYVSVSTYITETQSGEVTSVTGDKIEVYSDVSTDGEGESTSGAGVLLAILDTETGDLELRNGAWAEIRESDGSLPTRFVVMLDDTVYANFFVVPDVENISIGDGLNGVFVNEFDSIYEGQAEAVTLEGSSGTALSLQMDGQEIGVANAKGQIAIANGYYLEFDDPADLNIYDPIHIYSGDGETLFTVTVKHGFVEGEILEPEGDYDGWLARVRDAWGEKLSNLKTWILRAAPLAWAAEILDSDGDRLDDLEEWTIGTDLANIDTDADGYSDGQEVYSGFDPLDGSGGPLFTDISGDHEAYHAIATLYLRGILSGYADGSFLPDRNMTREEFIKVDLGAVCLACTNYDKGYETALMSEYYLTPFPDSNINPELLACVAEAKTESIVSGYASGEYSGYFLPGRYISRAEATKVLIETAGIGVRAAGVDEFGMTEQWYDPYVEAAETYELFPAGAERGSDGEITETWLADYITRAEFAMMAVNLLDSQDCRAVDEDGDGLSDTEERVVYGTDPGLMDTDGGGVNDFDEVVRGSDPLDASDDFPGDGNADDGTDDDGTGDGDEVAEDFGFLDDFDHMAGLYAVSDRARYEAISSSAGDGDTEVSVFTGDIPADGESILFVRGEIRDGEGDLARDDDSSVIEFILSSSEYGQLMSSRVQVSGGMAETSFVTSQVAGELTVEGRMSDGSLPGEYAEVEVYPGEPARISLTSDSSVLPAGGEADTAVRATLYDGYGNVANYGFYTITVETAADAAGTGETGGLEILDLVDEDAETAGTQVTTPDGYIDFRVLASTSVGVDSIYAYLAEDASGEDASDEDEDDSGVAVAELEIDHIDGMQIQVAGSRAFMIAGGQLSQDVTVNVTDRIGRLVDGYNEDVTLSLSDPAYGELSVESVTLDAGEASLELSPGTLAGTGSIVASCSGIESGSASFVIKPGDPYELRIRQYDDTFVLEAGTNAKFYVEGYDEYGNLVTNDSASTGTIRITEATSEYGELISETFTLNQGQATFYARIGNLSGVFNLVASGTSGGSGGAALEAGSWSGEIDFSVSGEDFAEMQPQMLYASLLGAPFGDVTEENYIGGWMTFNGKTQAVTSLISEPVPKKRLVTIDAEGSVSLANDSLVTQTVMSAGTELPARIQWRSFPDDTLIGEAIYVIDASGQSSDGESVISAELVSNRTDLELEQDEDGELVLREESVAAVKIRTDGQISIVDPNYSLAVNAAADGLSFAVQRTTETVARIDFVDAAFASADVTALDSNFDLEDWDSLDPGLYIRPTSATENNLVAVPSGNSTANGMGLALVDPDEDLPSSMQPSLGYASLESAELDGGIGWEDENKHLLLFAAGNTVGQSNLYYPSEVGVVLGDPSVSVTTENEVNSAGFTADVGQMVYASQEDILTLLDLDYNADGQVDVLVVYEDGRIDVMQNTNSPERLQTLGSLLFIENGIESIDKGDFNGDGMDDLLVVTDESCYADEMCLYAYENIGGGFVARNLTLEGMDGDPDQIVVADMNNDGYDELVLTNEDMMLYVVWNAEGELDTVDEVKDFGLNADGSQNLYADVALTYYGLEEGSVSLAMEVESEEAEALLDEISASEDYEVNAGSTTVLENQTFDYADNLEDYFAVEKTMDDDNGGKVQVGDTLTFTMEIENVSGQGLSNVYVSDLVGGVYEYEESSIVCTDCTASNYGAVEAEGALNHPWIFGPLRFSSGTDLTLEYQVEVTSLPRLSVMVGQDFYGDYKNDNFADIAVSVEGNNTGTLMLYYSDGYVQESRGGGLLGIGSTDYRRMSYQEKTYSPDDSEYEDEYDDSVEEPFDFEDADGDGAPDFVAQLQEEDGVPIPSGYDPYAEIFGAEDGDGDGYYSSEEMFSNDDDVDNDGVIDTVDFFVSTASLLLDPSLDLDVSDDEVSLSSDDELVLDVELEKLDESVEVIGQKIEEIAAKLTCSGGCLSLPGSVAFLAPGIFHDPITGSQLAKDRGLPVFGILTATPFVCTLALCDSASVFRIYLAPTTTLGLGTGLCFGMRPASMCFAFQIPIMQMLGVCDAINNFISDSLSKATAYVGSGDTKAFNVEADQGGSDDPTGLASSVFESYIPPTVTNKNIQIPGFPSIFTEWWKAQKHEFVSMLDLPDITMILPDPRSLVAGSLDLGKDDEVDELKGGIFGMENFLNAVHSLPLIDIETETVDIHYPTLTPEEIELIRYDWEQWIVDLKGEWDVFKDDFIDLKGDGDANLEALEDLINEIAAAMEANLAALDSYREIPQEILKVRELQVYYAKQIICYLDAILSHTAGYMLDNALRIQAWAKWVKDLKDIVSGWQALIGLSIDLMDSCDKCTNQRYSSWEMLMSLFVFLPELPIIEMPKLPDIVIDVSSIQVGLDVTWPQIEFVPETVNIPDVPRIHLPTVTAGIDLDLSALLDIDLDIPVLPTFPVLYDPPELPGLSLPDLPTLPPAPELPTIDPTLEAGLNITSSIVKIICIIRSGFVPVKENNLKTKIEEITERPGGMVLPFDLKTTTEFGNINFDFWKKVKITTYLNLTTDFTGIFDFVQAIADESDDFVDDILEEFEGGMRDLQNDLEEAIDFSDIEIDMDAEMESDVELDLGYDASTDGVSDSAAEAYAVADMYRDHPLLSGNLTMLQDIMEDLVVEFDEWDEAMPDEYLMVAEERLIAADDPLLHRYDEIADEYGEGMSFDGEFLASIQDTPLAAVATMRDSLLAYVEDYEGSTRVLESMDGESFNTYLAMESETALNPHVFLADSAFAADGMADESGPSRYSTGLGWSLDSLKAGADENLLDGDLDVILASEEEADDDSVGSYNDGLYIYNEDYGTLRLAEYKQEADEPMSILFVDLDDDGDEDIVYSMGGDVYIKENHERSSGARYLSTDPAEGSVAELAPAHGTVKNLYAGDNDYEEVSFSFSSAPEATAYELLLYDSLDASDAEREENIKRVLLAESVQNESAVLYDSDGEEYGRGSPLASYDDSAVYQVGSDAPGAGEISIVVPEGASFDLPEIRESRVLVNGVSGSVTLWDAPKRTRVSANGELETNESVIFQTIEKSVIKVTEGSDTTQLEVPAGFWIDFGSAQNRVIRVDSGEVFWIQSEEIEEEQDLEVGMEIFAGEAVSLESGLAQAEFETSEGAPIVLDEEEMFVIDSLSNPEDPTVKLALENGAYYTLARGIYEDGNVGTLGSHVLLNPQVCGDDSAPYPIISDSEVDLAVFSTTELSAETSFDSDSEIIDSYWDLDDNVDVDGDGDTTNDEEVIGLTAEIGPYETIGERNVTLWVTDAAGNLASADVLVNVYVPDIRITEASTTEVAGDTSPESSDVPFHLVRDRNGALTELDMGAEWDETSVYGSTPGSYFTDEHGEFTVSGFDDSNLLSIYDSEGNQIAQFNPETKQLLVYDNAYEAAALASDDNWPSRLAIYKRASGQIMGSFVIVNDMDDYITASPVPLEDVDLAALKRVTVYIYTENDAASDKYEINTTEVIGRDAVYGDIEFMVSNTGNITIFDDSYEIVKREADSLDEYLVIEVYDEGELELEIYPGDPGSVFLTTTDGLELPASTSVYHEDISGDYRLYFEDIEDDDPLYEDIAELVERGILEGYDQGDLRYFLPDNEINRAEFAKIILGILCIVPRDEARELANVFNDILSTADWYYPYTKEAYLSGLITGYLGEVDASGLAPFKPNQTITRAEAAKIVLEALDAEGIIALPDDFAAAGLDDGGAWYEPYIEIAQDLDPYLAAESSGEANYILTASEAADPSHVVTRYEFVEMSVRVLAAYNCFDLDSDGDGLINYDEEAVYGTDPYNPDTDYGGVDDGTEVGRGTDPLDEEDDFDGGGLEVDPGVYAIREACLSCPCTSNIDYDSDLQIGDIIFAIIQNSLGEILGKSNEVEIE
jgi:uncharacterized repeat protein (TIGR01451 family)